MGLSCEIYCQGYYRPEFQDFEWLDDAHPEQVEVAPRHGYWSAIVWSTTISSIVHEAADALGVDISDRKESYSVDPMQIDWEALGQLCDAKEIATLGAMIGARFRCELVL